jgi:hypothetical protein
MGINSIFVEDPFVRAFLNQICATWVFIPPHASHFGGAWERMIGTTRRILDAMLLRTTSKGVTHEILSTYMAEVCSIINSRPIIPASSKWGSPLDRLEKPRSRVTVGVAR